MGAVFPGCPAPGGGRGRVDGGQAGPGPGGGASYLGQRPRAQPAAARPAAPGAAGAPRGGAAGAFLLSRRRRRLPGRAQNIHGLCPGSRPPRPGRSPRRMPGASAKFFVPLTCSLAPPGRLWTPYARSLLSPPAAASPPPAGQSRAVGVALAEGECPPARTLRRARPATGGCRPGAPLVAAAAAPPALRARSLALSFPQLVTFHQLSSPGPQPDQWQKRAQAGDPAPPAASSQHPHPLRLPRTLWLPRLPKTHLPSPIAPQTRRGTEGP